MCVCVCLLSIASYFLNVLFCDKRNYQFILQLSPFFEAIIRQTVTENRADFVNKINNAKALGKKIEKSVHRTRNRQSPPVKFSRHITLPPSLSFSQPLFPFGCYYCAKTPKSVKSTIKHQIPKHFCCCRSEHIIHPLN